MVSADNFDDIFVFGNSRAQDDLNLMFKVNVLRKSVLEPA